MSEADILWLIAWLTALPAGFLFGYGLGKRRKKE
jgi:hypothetical protein